MSTYAIGDLQGCFDALQRLLKLCAFDPAKDYLWLTGDLVNRGEQSLETLRYLYALGGQVRAVLGNHDLHLLARAYGGRGGKRDTLDALLSAPDRDQLIHWLRHLPLMYEHDGWLMVHAGVAPAWDLPTARRAARLCEDALRGPDHARFLTEMYGDEPRLYTPALRGKRRLRFAINAFTRMRFVQDNGSLEFKQKTAPAEAPAQFKPWFAADDRCPIDREILFGHWSTLGKVHWPEARVWGLDTGAVWGGRLTALRLDDRQLFQVDCPENRRPGMHDME